MHVSASVGQHSGLWSDTFEHQNVEDLLTCNCCKQHRCLLHAQDAAKLTKKTRQASENVLVTAPQI